MDSRTRLIIFKRKLSTAAVILLVWILVAAMATVFEYLFLTNFPGVLETAPMASYSFGTSMVAALLWALLGGISFCTIELFYLQSRLEGRSFLQVVSIKLVIYSSMLVVINLLTSAVYNAITFHLSFFSGDLWANVGRFAGSLSFWHPLLPFIAILLVTLFLIQINYKFGQGELWKYIRGKYFVPREEERIFMFLDIASSTTIAEQLGNIKFFNFINDFYKDITNDIITNLGDIVDYVGDEIIVSWSIKNGIAEARCLRCFFDIQKRMEKLSGYYEKAYGLRPHFRAGIHLGGATVGEIGKIKKEITYFGDVMNTTSRIQGLSKEKGVELVISGAVLELLPKHNYKLEDLGEIQLRGKTTTTSVYGVRFS